MNRYKLWLRQAISLWWHMRHDISYCCPCSLWNEKHITGAHGEQPMYKSPHISFEIKNWVFRRIVSVLHSYCMIGSNNIAYYELSQELCDTRVPLSVRMKRIFPSSWPAFMTCEPDARFRVARHMRVKYVYSANFGVQCSFARLYQFSKFHSWIPKLRFLHECISGNKASRKLAEGTL